MLYLTNTATITTLNIRSPPQHELIDWTLIFLIGAVIDVSSNVLYLIFAKAEPQPFDRVKFYDQAGDEDHDIHEVNLKERKQRK